MDIIDGLVAEFEEQKKDFSGENDLLFVRPGFPRRQMNNMEGENLIVDKVDVRNFFKRQLEVSINLVKAQIASFGKIKSERPRKVHQVILAGGVNGNYIRNAIRQEPQRVRLEMLSQHKVNHPKLERFNTWTSRGALLLLEDKKFVHDRILRRGYCYKWDKPTEQTRSTKRSKVVIDEEDGTRCLKDATKFLLHAGQRIGHHHKAYLWERHHNQWFFSHANLTLEPTADDTGFNHARQVFLIGEDLYYSDKPCKDGAWVEYPKYQIRKAGTLKFELGIDFVCQNFFNFSFHDRVEYRIAEYLNVIEIEGLDFHLKTIFSMRGVFQKQWDDLAGWAIVKESTLSWDDEGVLCSL